MKKQMEPIFLKSYKNILRKSLLFQKGGVYVFGEKLNGGNGEK
jgi:hypothetical protein